MFWKLKQGEKSLASEIDTSVHNKWNFKWLEATESTTVKCYGKTVEVAACVADWSAACVADSIDKIDKPGSAYCKWCCNICDLFLIHFLTFPFQFHFSVQILTQEKIQKAQNHMFNFSVLLLYQTVYYVTAVITPEWRLKCSAQTESMWWSKLAF